MRTLLFEVHGESVDNRRGLASGHRDAPLSPLGRRHARDLGDRHRSEPPAAVFCSDLRRAYATAELAFAGRPIPITRDARLRECDFGTWTGRPAKEIEAAREAHLAIPFPGGESYTDVVQRVAEFLDELRANAAWKHILIIGHRGTWYALEHLLGGRSLPDVIRGPWRWQPGWRYHFASAKEYS